MSKYGNLYQFGIRGLKSLESEQNAGQYTGLINEINGGVDIYIHNEIISSLCCFLAWEHPLQNKHITDIDHEDYDGWCSKGWDVHISSLPEHIDDLNRYGDNKISLKDGKDIFIGKIKVGILFNTELEDFYTDLILKWMAIQR